MENIACSRYQSPVRRFSIDSQTDKTNSPLEVNRLESLLRKNTTKKINKDVSVKCKNGKNDTFVKEPQKKTNRQPRATKKYEVTKEKPTNKVTKNPTNINKNNITERKTKQIQTKRQLVSSTAPKPKQKKKNENEVKLNDERTKPTKRVAIKSRSASKRLKLNTVESQENDPASYTSAATSDNKSQENLDTMTSDAFQTISTNNVNNYFRSSDDEINHVARRQKKKPSKRRISTVVNKVKTTFTPRKSMGRRSSTVKKIRKPINPALINENDNLKKAVLSKHVCIRERISIIASKVKTFHVPRKSTDRRLSIKKFKRQNTPKKIESKSKNNSKSSALQKDIVVKSDCTTNNLTVFSEGISSHSTFIEDGNNVNIIKSEPTCSFYSPDQSSLKPKAEVKKVTESSTIKNIIKAEKQKKPIKKESTMEKLPKKVNKSSKLLKNNDKSKEKSTKNNTKENNLPKNKNEQSNKETETRYFLRPRKFQKH